MQLWSTWEEFDCSYLRSVVSHRLGAGGDSFTCTWTCLPACNQSLLSRDWSALLGRQTETRMLQIPNYCPLLECSAFLCVYPYQINQTLLTQDILNNSKRLIKETKLNLDVLWRFVVGYRAYIELNVSKTLMFWVNHSHQPYFQGAKPKQWAERHWNGALSGDGSLWVWHYNLPLSHEMSFWSISNMGILIRAALVWRMLMVSKNLVNVLNGQSFVKYGFFLYDFVCHLFGFFGQWSATWSDWHP